VGRKATGPDYWDGRVAEFNAKGRVAVEGLCPKMVIRSFVAMSTEAVKKREKLYAIHFLMLSIYIFHQSACFRKQ